jgi:hypothetical protein
MANQREYEIEKTFTAVRYEGDKQQGPSVRFEVSPGCFVTVFDDGHVRFRVNESDDYSVSSYPRKSSTPTHHILETKMKKQVSISK